MIELTGSPEDANLRRVTFTGVLTQPVSGSAYRRMQTALDAGSPRLVYGQDPEFAPFYCPTCDATYCGDHWIRWDVFDQDPPNWHDSIRGRCPEGHERLLED